MSDLSERAAELSPEQRSALLRRLRERRARGSEVAVTYPVEPLPRAGGGGGSDARSAGGGGGSGGGDEFVLSFGQEQLWFLQRLAPEGAAYNVPVVYRLCGELDVGVLRGALVGLVGRHEVLRSVFVEGAGGGPVQRVVGGFVPELVVEEVAGASARERLAAARLVAKEDSERPFDLGVGPPWRVRLLRVADDEHVLVLVLHHIVCDGWSIPLLMRELGELYSAGVEGRAVGLAPLAVQYADVAVAQRRWLEGEAAGRLSGYWRERLAGLEPLELPVDRPRPAVQTFVGGSVAFVVPSGVVEGLRGLARGVGATLFMVLVAAFDVLLWRYSGQGDVAVASPTSGRAHPDTQGLIGFFVNTLVLRVDVSGDPSFVGLLERVRAVALGAYAHQEMPFERLVAELAPQRDPSRNPLVPVAIALGQQIAAQPTSEEGMAGLRVEPAALRPDTAQFELGCAVDETADGLAFTLIYNSDLFEEETVARMGRNLQALLRAAVEDPHRRISALPLDEAERAELEAWARGPRAAEVARAARTRCPHELFEQRAAAQPDAVALVVPDADEREVTFGELDRRANRLAHALRARGVGRGDLVALCGRRSARMVTAMLGVLKAGAAYLPVDLNQPPDRLGMVFEEARPCLALADPGDRDGVPAGPREVLDLDPAAAWAAGHPATSPGVAVLPDDLFYVCYTSGSTGRPKGAEVPHRALTGFIEGAKGETFIPWSPDLAMLHHCSVSWDVHLLDIWPCLVAGGRLVIFTGRTLSAPALRDHVAAGANAAFLTVTLLNNLVDIAPDVFTGIRYLVTGGESPSGEHLRRLTQRHPDLKLIVGYGPTETTVGATAGPVPEDVLAERDVMPLGPPIGDREIWVADEGLELVPVRAVGELCIGGPAVARGYVRRPGLTAEAFVADPFGGEAGARLYRTGDLVRRRNDGTVEFVGRDDDQVKVRGFRVELGEIEHALRAHPAVEDCAVLAPEGPAGRQLVAYFVPRRSAPQGPPAGAQLREFLAARVPDYMVPAIYVPLDALPMTANGKLDRRALPEPDEAALPAGEDSAPPETPVQELLAGIWAAVLGREQVGVDDDFFALGGHSLLAAQVAARVGQRLPIELPLSAVFEQPSVRQLAERVEALLVEHVEGLSDAEVDAIRTGSQQ